MFALENLRFLEVDILAWFFGGFKSIWYLGFGGDAIYCLELFLEVSFET